MKTAAIAVAIALLALSSMALAVDQPISAVKLELRQYPSGKQKLIFKSTDPAALFPAFGGPDDPTTQDLVIEVFSPSSPNGGELRAPATGVAPGWTAKPGNVGSYKFKRGPDSATVTAVKGVIIREGKQLAVTADATGIPLPGQSGRIGIRFRSGGVRNCALASGSAVVTDVAGHFAAKKLVASGLADCSKPSLSGAPPTCGDGEVDQSSETCDGDDLGTCAAFGLSCRPAGFAPECSCCSADGYLATVVGCCDPSAILIAVPPDGGFCIPTRCDPPFTCSPGDQCQNDGSCCGQVNGSACVTVIPSHSIVRRTGTCCPGLDCRTADANGYGCCVADGGACATNADCCTHDCQAGTCAACRVTGAGCTQPADCCSGACNAGTCGACRAGGAFCTSGTTCCSGSCATNLTCDP